jgi:hypothetical protein
MTRSIAELHAKGLTFEATEAVAIAQQLISGLLSDAAEVRPPYGPPSVDSVWLQDDGSVVCLGCRTTPAVSEVGIFLEALLPAGSPRVPGGLRYTIARALLNVDVPPFDSLADLSRDLERHERGDRVEVVRGVLARASGQRSAALSPLSLVERRTARTSASELRRALREADARWYEHQLHVTPAAVIDLYPPPTLPPRDRTPTAAAVCLTAGLALICTGEFMHRRQAPILETSPAPIVAQTAAAEPPRVEQERGLERGIILVRDVPSSPARASRPADRRFVVKRASALPSTAAVRRQAGPRSSDRGQVRPPSRGVLDRLRLGWLRSAFNVHSDL